MTSRREFLIRSIAGGAFIASVPAKAIEPAADKMNIILIMSDDQGFETIGAYGGESYHTPRIDELARTGMLFENAHATPVCTPTRVKIMSGKYNSRNYTRFGEMDPEIHTFGNLFKEAGYSTFIGGKWQLGGGLDAPRNFGFEEHVLWQLTRTGGEKPNRYPNPGLAINGRKVNFTDGEYGPDIVNDHVCGFIERNKDKPFLVYYPMILPHWPFEPTPDSADWNPSARRDDATETGGRRMQDARYFKDMVEYVDKLVGRIVDKLDELEIRDKTLLVFTSDNGSERGLKSVVDGSEFRGGKLMSTDAGTRVPLVVNCPGYVIPNVVRSELICFTYFFPTLAEVADIDVPDDLDLDGVSFAPLLRGEDSKLPDWIYMWWYRDNNPNRPGAEFARTLRYKYYHDGRLYDLQSDPLERDPIPVGDQTLEQVSVRTRLSDIIRERTRPGFYD